MKRIVTLVFLSLTLSIGTVRAGGDFVGTLTQLQGEVKLFTHPSKKIEGPAPHALFEGEYYSVRDAKSGDQVENGNILRTPVGAQARVVFENGDQFNLGGGTAYRIFWDSKARKPGAAAVKGAVKPMTELQLMYGKLRGVISKAGPRNRLSIKTRTAVMGVRGTDFFIADEGDKGTEVSVLRGAVEVKPEAPKAKPIEVKAGFSAEVPAPLALKAAETGKSGEKKAEEPAPAPVVELRKTTQEELTSIQKASTIKPQVKEEIAKTDAKPEAQTAEAQKKIEELEKKAVENSITDIKTHDPKLYAQLQDKGLTNLKSANDVNAQTVQEVIKAAPKAPEKRKPFRSELEDLEQGAYEKYFKLVD